MAKYEVKKTAVEAEDIEIVKENIKNLLLDNQNPRLPLSLHNGSEKQILSWMLANGSLLELMVSITQNGYFDGEPLMVVPSNNNDGKYIVIEGNRRLSAVKILNNPNIVSEKENSIAKIISEAKELPPKELPVLKFNSELEILDYLGYRHITGVKQWNPLAKARYLDKLFKAKKDVKDWNERYALIANIIGSKGHYVKRMHTAFRVYERIENKQFFDIPGLSELTIEFSNLNDALTKFSNISAYVNIDFKESDPLINLNIRAVKNLVEWMFYRNPENNLTRIGEVRNLSKLNIVLDKKSDLARKEFLSGSTLDKAFSLTGEPNKNFSDSLVEAFSRLQIAQQLFYSIDNPNKEDLDVLRRINHLSSDFFDLVNDRLQKTVKKV